MSAFTESVGGSLEDVAYNVACAIDELVQAIRDLEARVKQLEFKGALGADPFKKVGVPMCQTKR